MRPKKTNLRRFKEMNMKEEEQKEMLLGGLFEGCWTAE